MTNQWYKEGQYWEPKWMGNNAVTRSEERETAKDDECIGPLSDRARELFARPLEERFNGRPVNAETLDELYNAALESVNIPFRAITESGKECCGVIQRFIILTTIDGVTTTREFPPDNEGRLGIVAEADFEPDEAGNEFELYFGIDQCLM